MFSVPRERLYFPRFELSIAETEVLFLGEDLHTFHVGTYTNPFLYLAPAPPPLMLTAPTVGRR